MLLHGHPSEQCSSAPRRRVEELSPRPASHHSFHLAAESKVSKVSTVVVAVVASARFRQRNSQLSQEQAKLQGVASGVAQLIHILEAKAAVHHGLRTSGLKDQGLTGSSESIELFASCA
jgi:hypothetical protein